jgi:hypothetical protein
MVKNHMVNSSTTLSARMPCKHKRYVHLNIQKRYDLHICMYLSHLYCSPFSK